MRYVFVGSIGMLFLPFSVAAQVIINEIAWMGAPIDGVDSRQWWRYEWIELYNLADADIALDGWKVRFYREQLDFELGLYGRIPAQGYFLIAASDRIRGVDVNYANLSGKFANTGQRVVLSDNTGTVVDEVEAISGWFGGDNDLKLTMERRFPDRDENDADNWGTSQTTGGTPKNQNSLFGKEKFAPLSQNISMEITKKDPLRVSLWGMATNKIFIRAFLIALVSAAGILVLYQHVRLPSEGSSGAPRH